MHKKGPPNPEGRHPLDVLLACSSIGLEALLRSNGWREHNSKHYLEERSLQILPDTLQITGTPSCLLSTLSHETQMK